MWLRAWATGAVVGALAAWVPAGIARADTLLNPGGTHDTSLSVSAGTNGGPTQTDPTSGLGADRSLSASPFIGGGGPVVAGPISGASYILTSSLFQIDTGHTLTPGLGDFARAEGAIYFTVDQDASYSLSGFYDVGGIDSPDTIDFTVTLGEAGAPGSLFATTGTPGDANVLSGPGLTGTLLANHEYLLSYRLGIANNLTAPSAVIGADGGLTLDIQQGGGGGGAVVPLPSAAWGGLVLLGGLGVAARLRREPKPVIA
jgi:hypothetical protein